MVNLHLNINNKNFMIELEKTYLVKELPSDLENFEFKEVVDVYIPKQSDHPSLRLRKNGNKFEITKKEPVKNGDASEQREQTIILTEIEFEVLNKLEGKRVSKLRYNYSYQGHVGEIDVFQDALKGLVLADFEFSNADDKNNFEMPNFCLADITQEKFLAGGMLCGKSYSDIEENLNRFDYKKLS